MITFNVFSFSHLKLNCITMNDVRPKYATTSKTNSINYKNSHGIIYFIYCVARTNS